ncbi:MAG TPA: F0F1 ATP synthase subunit delta [Nitrospirota bacterium]
MKFSITTFVIQVINFALLTFILYRVLYKPLKAIMDKRRRLVMESVDRALVMKEDAVRLKEKYEALMQGVESFRVSETERVVREAEEAKKQILDTARKEAREEKEKAAAVVEYERSGMMEQVKSETAKVSSGLAANLLRPLADVHMHRKLMRMMMEELEFRPPAPPAGGREGGKAVVSSAYELSQVEKMEIESLLKEHLGQSLVVEQRLEPELIAGVKIWAEGQVLDGSIAGQLAGFRERAVREME